jgi:hypothetical protein
MNQGTRRVLFIYKKTEVENIMQDASASLTPHSFLPLFPRKCKICQRSELFHTYFSILVIFSES